MSDFLQFFLAHCRFVRSCFGAAVAAAAPAPAPAPAPAEFMLYRNQDG